MNIGTLQIGNPVISAPMSGVTDKAFRILAEEAGCGLVFTEMISVNALAYDSERTKCMFDLTGEKGPTGVQIFGSDPAKMAAAAIAVAEAGADIVDINMGCPAPKVVKNLEGCALMTDLPLAEKIIGTVVKAIDIPVTVKMRKGWDESSVNAVELAGIAEACGAAAVTVHGRTRGQFYSGRADWEIIARVKQSIDIPVIGNGDITEPQHAVTMMNRTGCDAVMIGRGSFGNPWLLAGTVELLKTGRLLPVPDYRARIDMAIKHLCMAVSFKGERRAVREMRKHIAWYLKGLRDSARVRENINKIATVDEMTRTLETYRSFLDDNNAGKIEL